MNALSLETWSVATEMADPSTIRRVRMEFAFKAVKALVRSIYKIAIGVFAGLVGGPVGFSLLLLGYVVTEISVTGLLKLVSGKGHFSPILDVTKVANQIVLQMNQAFNWTGSWLFSGAPLAVFLGAGIGLVNVTDISNHTWCAYDPKAAAKQAIKNQFTNFHSFVLLNVAILASALVFSRQKE